MWALLMKLLYQTIITRALVGYEMTIANSTLRASLAIYHTTRLHGIIVNYKEQLIKDSSRVYKLSRDFGN